MCLMELTEAKIRQIAHEAAREAVHEALRELGVDPSDLRGTQADFYYLRQARLGSEAVGRWTRRALLGAGLSFIVWLIAQGIKSAMSGGPHV